TASLSFPTRRSSDLCVKSRQALWGGNLRRIHSCGFAFSANRRRFHARPRLKRDWIDPHTAVDNSRLEGCYFFREGRRRSSGFRRSEEHTSELQSRFD